MLNQKNQQRAILILSILTLIHPTLSDWTLRSLSGYPDMYRQDRILASMQFQYTGTSAGFTTDPQSDLFYFEPMFRGPLVNSSIPVSTCSKFRRSMFQSSIYALCGNSVYVGTTNEPKKDYSPDFSALGQITVAGASACQDFAINEKDLELFVVCTKASQSGIENAVDVLVVAIDMQNFAQIGDVFEESVADVSGSYGLAVVEADSGSDLVVLDEAAGTGSVVQWDSTGKAFSSGFAVSASPVGAETMIRFEGFGPGLLVLHSGAATPARKSRKMLGAKNEDLIYKASMCVIDVAGTSINCPTVKELNSSPTSGATMTVSRIYEIDREAGTVGYIHFFAGTTYTYGRINLSSTGTQIDQVATSPDQFPTAYAVLHDALAIGFNGLMFIGEQTDGTIDVTVYKPITPASLGPNFYQMNIFTAAQKDPNRIYMLSIGTFTRQYVFYSFLNDNASYDVYNDPWMWYDARAMEQDLLTTNIKFRANMPGGATPVDSEEATFVSFKHFSDGISIDPIKFFTLYTGNKYILPTGEFTTGNAPYYSLETPAGDVTASAFYVHDTSIQIDADLQADNIGGADQLGDGYYMSTTPNSDNSFTLFQCSEVPADILQLSCAKTLAVTADAGLRLVGSDLYKGKLIVWLASEDNKSGFMKIVDIASKEQNDYSYNHPETILAYGLRAYFMEGAIRIIMFGAFEGDFGGSPNFKSSKILIGHFNIGFSSQLSWSRPDLQQYYYRLCINKFEFTENRESYQAQTSSNCGDERGTIVFTTFFSHNSFIIGAPEQLGSEHWCLTKKFLHTDNPAVGSYDAYMRSLTIFTDLPGKVGLRFVQPIGDYYGTTSVTSIGCSHFEDGFFYLQSKGDQDKDFMFLFNADMIGVDNRKRLHSVMPTPNEFINKELVFFTSEDKNTVILFTTENNFGKAIAFKLNEGPRVEIDATLAKEESHEDLTINLQKYDGSHIFNSYKVKLNIFEAYVDAKIKGKAGKEIEILDNGEEQKFVLNEFFDFEGPLVNIVYSGSNNQTNQLIQRQRPIETEFKFLTGEYSGVETNGQEAIVWNNQANSVKFVKKNGDSEETVQELQGTLVTASLIQIGDSVAYTAILTESGVNKLHVNYQGNALVSDDIVPVSAPNTKMVELDSASSTFVIIFTNEDSKELNFKKITVSASELTVQVASAPKELEGELFDMTAVASGGKAYIGYTVTSLDSLQFISLGDNGSDFGVLGSFSADLELDKFETSFYGRQGRIACSTKSETSLECAVSDSVYNLIMLDVTLDDSTVISELNPITSFIIPSGFDSQKLIRSQNQIYWSGVKRTSGTSPKALNTVLDQDYLVLVYNKDESEHAVMTLTPSDTGVPLAKFGQLSPFITYDDQQRPVFNYNTAKASETGSLNAVLIDKFEWVVKDTKNVNLKNDAFFVEGYDPENPQKIPLEEVVKEERKGSNGFILAIALIVVALIGIFVACCVFIGAKNKKNRKSEVYEEGNDAGRKSDPLLHGGEN